MKRPERTAIPYDEARRLVRNGDLLLWRPTGPMGRLIAWGTGSRYSHAAVACWVGDVLLQCEFLQWHGGRAVTLSSQVQRWPDACDVYRVPRLAGRLAAHAILRRTGSPYGWRNFARIGWRLVLVALGFRRWIARRARRDVPDDCPVVCFEAAAAACHAGHKTPDRVIGATARDLVEPFSAYQFTIGRKRPRFLRLRRGLYHACKRTSDAMLGLCGLLLLASGVVYFGSGMTQQSLEAAGWCLAASAVCWVLSTALDLSCWRRGGQRPPPDH